jgi:5-methyltetrahydrofolate--homocysteine methyltransferase
MGKEILEQISKSMIETNRKEVDRLTKQAIQDGIPAIEILEEGLIPGIKVVGQRFSEGEYYLPELLVSGKAMQSAVEQLEPLLSKGSGSRAGKFLIGTVKGDIHDIGKNIVAMMLKGNMWDVTDLGVDVPPEKVCEAIKGGDYDIFGMSTLLTLTMPAAHETIEAIEEAGLRDKIKIMIGGAPITQEFADKIGADEYAQDVWEAVTKAERLVAGA